MATNTVRIIRDGLPDWDAKIVASWNIASDKFYVVESETYDNRYSLWCKAGGDLWSLQQNIPAREMMRVVAAWASRWQEQANAIAHLKLSIRRWEKK